MKLLTPSVLPAAPGSSLVRSWPCPRRRPTRDQTHAARYRTSSGALSPLPGAPPLITDDERRARIEKARRLMTEQGLGAIVLEPGTSMAYFVNVRWGLSERPFLLVIPAKGELAYISPGFEEKRAREITKFTNDVRVWQEDEDCGGGGRRHPEGSRRRDRQDRRRGARAVLHRRRHAQGGAGGRVSLATPVTAGCRMIKSPAEIALMQRANDITIDAYKAGLCDAARRA